LTYHKLAFVTNTISILDDVGKILTVI